MSDLWRCPVRRVSAALTLAALLFFPFVANAQDIQSLLDRIERLERDIRTLNVQIARGDAAASTAGENVSGASLDSGNLPTPSGIAHLDARISSLESDLRNATGRAEELGFQINQLTTRIDQLIGDVDYRLRELEKRPAATTSSGGAEIAGDGLLPVDQNATPEAVVPQMQEGSGVLGKITAEQLQQAMDVVTDTTASTETDENETAVSEQAVSNPVPSDSESEQPETSGQQVSSELLEPLEPSEPLETAAAESTALAPQDEYAQAFALLRQTKYEEAASALQSFVNRHEDHDLAPNARYWLGETYYVRSEFVRAAEIFFEAYRLAPQGAKAPDTLLKLGMALGNLGKKPEACAAFAKLAQEFQNPSAAIASRLDRERVRNGCTVN